VTTWERITPVRAHNLLCEVEQARGRPPRDQKDDCGAALSRVSAMLYAHIRADLQIAAQKRKRR
jgi:hypothetical protein